MMDTLAELDKKLFLYLNSFHSPWLDPIMFYASQTFIWVPLYLILLFVILKEYRNDSWAPLIGIFITILLADQITSGILKPIFERLRPSREPALEGLVHIVNGYKGGLYGFASSHAANTAGLSLFFWLLFRHKFTWIFLLFIWAAFVSYTRIYIGVHYPGDALAGMCIGIASAFAGIGTYRWLSRFTKKKQSLPTRSE